MLSSHSFNLAERLGSQQTLFLATFPTFPMAFEEILHALKPIYYVSNVLGTSPYRLFSDSAYAVPKYQTLRSIIKVLLVVFIMIPLQENFLERKTRNSVTIHIRELEYNCVLFCMSIVLIMNSFRNRDIIRFLDLIKSVHFKLELKTFKTKMKLLSRVAFGVVFVHLFTFTLTCIVDVVIFGHFYVFTSFFWMGLLNLTIECQSICFVRLVKVQFEILNDNLSRVMGSLARVSRVKQRLVHLDEMHEAKQMMKARGQLFEACKLLDRFYGGQFVLKIPLYFLMAATHTYYIIVSLLENKGLHNEQIVEYLWLTISATNIFVLFYTCDSLYTEVNVFICTTFKSCLCFLCKYIFQVIAKSVCSLTL